MLSMNKTYKRIDRYINQALTEFATWLRNYIVLGQRTRGVSFYPIHPAFSRPLNREEPRADGFIMTLVRSFSPC